MEFNNEMLTTDYYEIDYSYSDNYDNSPIDDLMIRCYTGE